MCTTYLVSEIIREFDELDLIGYPRLVRLNPNIPWKTRGNGAVCVRMGRGAGRRSLAGEIAGVEVHAYARERRGAIPDDAVERMSSILESNAHFDEEKTNPAFAVLRKKPAPSLYWQAVRGLVSLADVEKEVSDLGEVKKYKNGRGLIGATSAISWVPRDRTYEVITYRDRSKWGSPRRITDMSVRRMDRRTRHTFNNYDYPNARMAIAPSSPCPVLFGIRGDEPPELLEAMGQIDSEEWDRWNLFLTNQGTDDHLVRKPISEVGEHQSVIAAGRISREASDMLGGHTVMEIGDRTGTIECIAYEPSKQFRDVIRGLSVGDEVRVFGSVRDSPRTINLEKIEVLSLADLSRKSSNPSCPKCGKSMKSIGRGEGYRCRACHTRAGEDSADVVAVDRKLELGFYEPPVCARRHLSKPLSRMGIEPKTLPTTMRRP
jgi:tRNA(Ile2)-agmatinylcytidine synthase